jgi:DNA repair protein RadC
MTGPLEAVAVATEVTGFHNEAQEVGILLTVDAKSCVSSVYEVSRGSLESSVLHPREIFKIALLHNASGLILLHSHPSGDPTPSEGDVALTKRLVAAGELMGIPLLDHIIVNSECEFQSIREFVAEEQRQMMQPIGQTLHRPH